MTTAEALIAATTAFGGLTVSVVGWMITRAIGRVDAKVDLLIAKDGAQDLSIADCRTRLTAAEEEIARIRARIHRIIELSSPAWLKQHPGGNLPEDS